VGHPLLWLCGFLLFFESGNEFTVGGWTSTYLNEFFHLTPTQASFILAGYWAAIMMGRLIVIRLVRAVKNETLILGSALLSLVAAVILAASPTGGLAALGAVLIGLGFAAIYPTTLAIIGGAFPALSGTAFSVIFVIGLAGGMTAPWLTGKVALASSLRHGFFIPVFSCAMIVILQLVIMRLLKTRKST
jgi:fucose permease